MEIDKPVLKFIYITADTLEEPKGKYLGIHGIRRDGLPPTSKVETVSVAPAAAVCRQALL